MIYGIWCSRHVTPHEEGWALGWIDGSILAFDNRGDALRGVRVMSSYGVICEERVIEPGHMKWERHCEA